MNTAAYTLDEIADAYEVCNGDVTKTAKKLGYCVRHVYYLLAKARKEGCLSPGHKNPEKAGKPQNDSVIVLSVKLPTPTAMTEMQVRDSNGTLLGTVCVGQSGICYRRPNQKTPSDRKISWANLDRLMQLGLLG